MEMTRPEKSKAMSKLVYALRQTAADRAVSGELNLAECINAMGQAMASIIAGAYSDKENREIVLSFLPDLVRGYLPQWDKIYTEHNAASQTHEEQKT